MARDGEDNKSVIIEARDDAQLVSNRFQSQSSPMMVKLILSIRSGNSWLQTRKSNLFSKIQRLKNSQKIQVLHRTYTLIENFSTSFAALYFVGGVRVTYTTGIASGGPLAYWLVVHLKSRTPHMTSNTFDYTGRVIL